MYRTRECFFIFTQQSFCALDKISSFDTVQKQSVGVLVSHLSHVYYLIFNLIFQLNVSIRFESLLFYMRSLDTKERISISLPDKTQSPSLRDTETLWREELLS
jgi:hypothetical protein